MAIDREKALQQAQKYIDRKKFDRALEEYQRVLREDAEDTRTLLKLGDLQIRMKAFADAMATYDRVAQLYERQGFAVKAVAVYKQIRDHIQKRSPDLAERFAHITPRLAKIYADLQLTSDAIQAYDEVATRLLRLGKRAEAVEAFRDMVRLDATNPLTHVRLAEALCHTGAVEDGLNSFAQAVELLLRISRREDALRVIDRALQFQSDARLARLAAEVHLQGGTREDGLQALTKLQVCFQSDPKDLTVLGMLAQAFSLLGQRDKAIEVYKQMALLAREKGEQEMFDRLVEYLTQNAPDDDQVRALQHLAQTAGASRRPPPSQDLPEVEATLLSEDDDELESLDDEVEFVEDSVSIPPSHDVAPALGDALPTGAGARSARPFDGEAHARSAIADAESFRRLRLFDKALETLRRALQVDPVALDIRYRLREMLQEAGDRAGMLAESLSIAQILVDARYVQEAVPFLEELLGADPDNPEAIRLYTGVYGQPPARSSRQPSSPAEAPTHGRHGEPSVLPSYDLEGGQEALDTLSSVAAFSQVDDPFGQAADLSSGRELPSFALDDLDDEVFGPEDFETEAAQPEEAAAPAVSGLESSLDEAEFFAARGLFDDARTILEEQLRRTPNHPLVLSKLREVAEMSAGVAGVAENADRSHVAPSLAPGDEGDELQATFRALDRLELRTTPSKAPPSMSVDVDQIFAQFRNGVRSQVDEGDSATHYDLGVAYKEMGLCADAIKEFELAARDPGRECMCCAMIGMIHLEQDQLEQATQAYIRGLNASVKTTEQELSLYYDLGIVYEMRQAREDALYYFQKIARKDPGYRDVSDRIAALQSEAAAPAAKPQSTDIDEDFDRAFDDLFGG